MPRAPKTLENPSISTAQSNDRATGAPTASHNAGLLKPRTDPVERGSVPIDAASNPGSFANRNFATIVVFAGHREVLRANI